MQSTENVDTVYLITLLDQLKQISELLNKSYIADPRESLRMDHEAKTRLDQLSIRIGKDIKAMQTQEAADDSEMPLGRRMGPIPAREKYTNG